MVEFLHLQPRPLASGAAAAAVVFAADAESLIVGAAGYDAALRIILKHNLDIPFHP